MIGFMFLEVLLVFEEKFSMISEKNLVFLLKVIMNFDFGLKKSMVFLNFLTSSLYITIIQFQAKILA